LPGRSQACLDRLARWLPSGAVDRKREDAIGLLTKLARDPELFVNRPHSPAFRLTEAWAYDLDAAGLWDEDIGSFLAEDANMT
jgi:hypothetical protein